MAEAAAAGIHGKSLEITVVGCTKLRDTEWFSISRQDPYVCLEYGSTKFRTKPCTDGGRKAQFHEKFVLTLIEGLRELDVSVFNKNTVTYDDFIGRGKVQLLKALSTGFDDNSWPLQSGSGRSATGEVRLIMHFSSNGVAPQVPPPYGVSPPYGVAHIGSHLVQNSPYPYASSPSQSTYGAAPPLPRPQAGRPLPNPYRPHQQPPAQYPHSQYSPPTPPPSNYPPSLYPSPPPSGYPPSPYTPPQSPYAHMSSTYTDPTTTYSHYPSRDVEAEPPESSHFKVDYYGHEY